MDEKPNQPGEPRPEVLKPTSEFKKRGDIIFRYSELFFMKAISVENDDLLLQFAVNDEFQVLIDAEEYSLYQSEVFLRSAECENKGTGYLDVCVPKCIFYGSSKQNVPIYSCKDLLDGLSEMETNEE